MAEGRVADIMSQGNGLDQIFVEPQKPADGTRDLGDQLHMQHTVGDVVVGNQVKNLSFVNVAGVGPAMQNSVSIQGEGLPVAGLHINDGMAPDA